eukprot:scaffold659951_cov70-Prasinocladus_malaysianus.AAC.1
MNQHANKAPRLMQADVTAAGGTTKAFWENAVISTILVTPNQKLANATEAAQIKRYKAEKTSYNVAHGNPTSCKQFYKLKSMGVMKPVFSAAPYLHCKMPSKSNAATEHDVALVPGLPNAVSATQAATLRDTAVQAARRTWVEGGESRLPNEHLCPEDAMR